MGVYQALGEQGLVVPDDVAVVSFDGSELACWLRSAVTSVALPFEQMGDLAVRLLLDAGGVGRGRRPDPVVASAWVPSDSGPAAAPWPLRWGPVHEQATVRAGRLC